MKRFLLTLFYCIGISAFASESFLVHGFNSEREFSQWRAPTGDSTTIKYNTDTNFISEGTGSAFLSFPPKSSGEGLWPRVSSNRVPLNGDWSAYDEFSIDLYNPGPDDVSFRIQLQVEGGGKLGRGWNQLAPGKHSLRAELPEAVKTMKIINIIIYQNQPPVAYSMYIDNYQIHLNKEKLQEKITNFFEDDPGNWKEAGLLNKHQKIAKELKKLKNSKISSIEKAKKVNKLNAEYKALKELRNKNLNELRVKEFAKIFPNNWGYGISHSLEKVFRKDFPYRGKISGPAEIYLARNERESFQVVLRSGQAVSNVKLSVSDLVLSTDSRVRISSDSIKIYPVGFIKAAKPPYPREELEWYPDPLLNFMDSFNLDANVWQAIWVDVRTSSSTPAGLYLGNITVNGDNVTELSIPVLVNVWDFALPKQNSLPVAIAHGSPQGFYKKNVPEADIEKIIIDAEDMLLRHRITPSPIYNSRYAVSPEEALRWQKAGGKEYNISYIQPVPAQTNEAYPEWVRKRVLNIMKEAIPKLRDAGVLQDAYIYTFDEITAERFYSAQTILKEIKQLYPEVPIATTAFDPTFGIESGLEDCIDIWIPSERSYVKNRERIDEIRKQGKKVWYYTCMYRKGMNFLLEATASAPRLLVGLNQYKEKSDGFLYYQTTKWMNPIIIDSGPLTTHDSRGYGAYNGDGILIYPGKNGVMPTIRLKAIGDGLEDLEYWFMLEKLQKSNIKMSARDRKVLTALLKVNPNVVKDFQNFDFEGKYLQSERIKAGELLSKYFRE